MADMPEWIKDSLKKSVDSINGVGGFDGHLTTKQTKDLYNNLNATSVILDTYISTQKTMIKKLEDHKRQVDRHAHGLKNSLYGEM